MSLSNHNPNFSTYGDCSNEQYDPDWWFPQEKAGNRNWTRTYEANAARNVCKTCPLLQECRDYSLQYSNLYGIWGGLDKYERHDIQKELNMVVTPFEFSYVSSNWRTANG